MAVEVTDVSSGSRCDGCLKWQYRWRVSVVAVKVTVVTALATEAGVTKQ